MVFKKLKATHDNLINQTINVESEALFQIN